MKTKPIALIVLDGWGYSEQTSHNAIHAAHTPYWNYLWSNYPHKLIEGSGRTVGLPDGQMGNSEVGHLHMGAGRLVPQDLMRIDLAIKNGDFFKNPIFSNVFNRLKQNNGKLHILGLLSPGGVHSHEQHLFALIESAAAHNLENIFLHGILDGRDTPPRSALNSIENTQRLFQGLNKGRFASIIGRYYAMDRDHRWDRTEKAYALYTEGKSDFYVSSAESALKLAYARGESDEFVQPTVIMDKSGNPITIDDQDALIFMNFRADRARQLSRAFTQPEFNHFARGKHPQLSSFITLTRYAEDIPADVAFPPIQVTNSLGEYLSHLHYTQLRIAETEKYAHVTFFFNGGIETPFPLEDRILIPSPQVATYDQQPEMSARELTHFLVDDILNQKHDVIICNFANPDMVGHTGNIQATIAAIEVIDECLRKINQALQQVGGEAIITADHGNAELMYDEKTGQPHTAHTVNSVPFIYIGRPATVDPTLGSLVDIAPTLLYLLGLPKPQEMQGESLVHLSL